MTSSNKVAASLAPPDTRQLPGASSERLASRIGLAEVRLDLMASFDVEKLVAGSPVPLVLTCRPERERGGFTGPEAERLAVLRAACDAGAAYIDVELDSLDQVTGWDGSGTRVIVSQHWYDRCPPTCTTATSGCANAATWSSWSARRTSPLTCSRCSGCWPRPPRRSSPWPWAPRAPAPGSWLLLSRTPC